MGKRGEARHWKKGAESLERKERLKPRTIHVPVEKRRGRKVVVSKGVAEENLRNPSKQKTVVWRGELHPYYKENTKQRIGEEGS